ncbi:BT4734/BF3469 family protein [Aeromonas veronii]|uniref:BT4734/BF3469 family protein n=1 Tax=Aeromonas veronii TaxID=654 RepID=UPI003D1BBDDA
MEISYKTDHNSTHVKPSTIAAMIDAVRRSIHLRDNITTIRQLKATGDTEDAQQAADIKSGLPGFYCGRFHDEHGGSGAAQPMTHTGIMVIDIDKIDTTQSEQIRASVLSSVLGPYTAFTFLSPSGGLKVGIRTDYHHEGTGDPRWYSYCYKRLAPALGALGVDLTKIDGSTCNHNRLTYLSHDPDATYNPEAKSVPLGRWRADFELIAEQQRQQLAAELERREALRKTGTFNPEHQQRHCEAIYRNRVSKMGPGNRHTLIWSLCSGLFEAGLSVIEVKGYLDRLDRDGHYTEGASTIAKAQDAYNSWRYQGGIPNDVQFYTATTPGQIAERFNQLSGTRSMSRVRADALAAQRAANRNIKKDTQKGKRVHHPGSA